MLKALKDDQANEVAGLAGKTQTRTLLDRGAGNASDALKTRQETEDLLGYIENLSRDAKIELAALTYIGRKDGSTFNDMKSFASTKTDDELVGILVSKQKSLPKFIKAGLKLLSPE